MATLPEKGWQRSWCKNSCPSLERSRTCEDRRQSAWPESGGGRGLPVFEGEEDVSSSVPWAAPEVPTGRSWRLAIEIPGCRIRELPRQGSHLCFRQMRSDKAVVLIRVHRSHNDDMLVVRGPGDRPTGAAVRDER